ncbi:hypothetical protein LV84_03591 [Algoriphagus ratkowskyi]|uniref:GyrI-like small molecule binding protein n=1 Tax=Algoriphagus ratkowskyi TaxID=57028 RepID=A0A2W7QTB3_9BACT|nr:hypothetical protein [Algoriphagus ratkowskyi]PZX51833.1 hypothetical protein LV84_03591 [Algoriphagus ratkowskyi]TXD76031.1 hypothetical protein ESW18_18210 [Algoriphagus ratkowskyi]
MKRIAILIVALISGFTILGFWAFSKLGGNIPVEIQLVENKPDNLAGLTYRGTPGNVELGKIFEKMETQKALHPGSQLHTIYEVEPAGKLDTMLVFVGINQMHPISDMEFRVFENRGYLLAQIKSSTWVMPSPEMVKEKLAEFAEANKLELSGIYIDKIISKNEVQVIAPIK